MKARKFVDSVTIHVRGGSGGNGCASFRREKYVPRGGPDGGDGGRGGHVILQGDHDVDSLVSYFFTPFQAAQNGEPGRGKQQYGRGGADRILRVPCGTQVYTADKAQLLGDIISDGQQLTVARGGKGGLGNCHWVTSTHRAPREHTAGGEGEELDLRLELKLLADAGLVGFPNAGKSSLLTRISDAHPKVAAYPFTTLNPIIGTLIFDDFTRVRVADIPGLIKDSHLGHGLGIDFLRHIERSAVLVYVIDMAGIDGRKPYEDYRNLREELKLYREDLLSRPSLVLANKMDLPESAANLKEFRRRTRIRPLLVSATTGEGIPALREALHEKFAGRSPA